MAKNEFYQDKPRPLTIKILVQNSLADNYEEARQEWDLDSYHPFGSQNTCDLCGNAHLKKNWIIRNVNTGKTLVVGSTCIKRFIILSGTTGQADTIRRLELKEKEYERDMELRVLYKGIQAPRPVDKDAYQFRKKLMEVLENRGLLHYRNSRDGVKHIIQTVFQIENPSEEEIGRIDDILNRFQIVLNLCVRDTKKAAKNKTIREGETWQRKSRNRVTGTSLSNSEAYRPDKNVDNK